MTARVRSLEAETSRTICFVAECQTIAFVRIKSRRKRPNSKGKQRSTPSAKSITHSGLICRRNRAAFRITTGIKQAAKPIMANRVRKAATTRTEIKSCIANISLLLYRNAVSITGASPFVALLASAEFARRCFLREQPALFNSPCFVLKSLGSTTRYKLSGRWRLSTTINIVFKR